MTTTSPRSSFPTFSARYAAQWRRTPRAAAFAAAIAVVALVGLAVLTTVFAVGFSLTLFIVGVPILAASLVLADGFARATMNLVAWAGASPARDVLERTAASDDGGVWARSLSVIRNPRGWRGLVHGMLVSPVLAVFTMGAAIGWIAIAVGGPTYWVWQPFLPESDGLWGHHVAASVPWIFGGMDAVAVQSVLYAIAGILALVSLPIVLGGLVAMNGAVARALIGPLAQPTVVAPRPASLAAPGLVG
jgi:hypothetical protein